MARVYGRQPGGGKEAFAVLKEKFQVTRGTQEDGYAVYTKQRYGYAPCAVLNIKLKMNCHLSSDSWWSKLKS